jgi:lipase chaperone LimK
MTGSRQHRIATLTTEVTRRRNQLAESDHALRIVPESERDRFLARMRKIGDELRQMEIELHELRVEQIREEAFTPE